MTWADYTIWVYLYRRAAKASLWEVESLRLDRGLSPAPRVESRPSPVGGLGGAR